MGSFNSQPPTKGTAIVYQPHYPGQQLVSILSPQQRGLQFLLILVVVIVMLFQFSAPNKGDCNLRKCLIKLIWYCFNSQPPTKGTAIRVHIVNCPNRFVSILSPQQRGLQYEEPDLEPFSKEVSILSPQQRGLQ